VHNGGEERLGGGDGAHIGEEEGGRGWGVWILIRPGAFWTMDTTRKTPTSDAKKVVSRYTPRLMMLVVTKMRRH
jgi:hypothetical protein